MTAPLLFVACFMFLAAVLLLVMISSQIHWVLKALLICGSLLFSGLFYIAFIDSLGYPTPAHPPGMFRFMYGIIREPYPAKDDPGAIYLWIIVEHTEEPRAIVVPFSLEDRQLVGLAKQRIAAGDTVYMALTANQRQATGAATETRTGNGSTGRGTTSLPYRVEGHPTLEFKTPLDTVPKKQLPPR
jgi:hypothetical protein